MYRVYCDGQLIEHGRLTDLRIHNPSLEVELNKTGSFTFTIYPEHPRYDLIRRMKSIITIYDEDDFLLFRGRVLDDEVGWHNEKTVSCEGDMAFLLDSIQRPYEFTGSITDYLKMLLDNHNGQVEAGKRFTLGNVTVTDANDYIIRSNIEYTDTWTEMKNKLLDNLGGYLHVRHEGNMQYLDYLKDVTLLAPQSIEFGRNLLDIKRIRKGADIATVIIPLGAKIKDEEGKDTDKRLTIASVNGGEDFILDADGAAQYGTIVKQVIFDDITDPQTLKQRGQAYLADSVNLPEALELTAADLAATGVDITAFHVGTMVRVFSRQHGIDQMFPVSKMSIKLNDPAASKLTLGGVVDTFTSKISKPAMTTAKDGKDGQDAVTLRIDSSRGTVFKNNEVNTVLQVVIFHGGNTITDAASLRKEFGTAAHLEWQWQRIGESTFGTILATDSRLTDEGFSLLLNPDDVDTKVVFKCQLVTA